MKCRVFKKQDGGVIYSWPSAQYQENFDNVKWPKITEGLDYVDLDESELPLESETIFHEMIHFDGECCKENLKVDSGWTAQLMPLTLIKQKKIKRCLDVIDSELDKDEPNVVLIFKKYREKSKCKAWSDKQWYEWALQTINDEQVDKPLIKQKLETKIEELRNEEV